MYWRITKDHLWEPGDSLPSRVDEHFKDESDAVGEIFTVRLLDDDGEIYYTGVSDDDAMEDLWNFGMTDAGSVLLQVKQPDGSWRDEIA